MIYYLLLPFFSFLFIVLQTTVFELLFLHRVSVEISLVLVIYAGFHMDVLKGGLLSFALGFFLDTITGSTIGLYVILYLSIFFISVLVSLRVYAERALFILSYVLVCALFECCVVLMFFKHFQDLDLFHKFYTLFLPQILVVSLISPACFNSFRRFGDILNVAVERSDKRARNR
ncbi:rod shape-determining protein MreD [Syntrophus gentianae]|uniref:Rod shape-determining protein MreD n=1 Tax=Syntrophus gentianae TaxID=43775 RepID=A0A1H7X338_9BACT|nr:rod shape-determining protein MreD [Syntrophus gentianae]